MVGSDDGDARTGFEEPFGLSKGDFARADDEYVAIFELEKDGIVLQFENVAR